MDGLFGSIASAWDYAPDEVGSTPISDKITAYLTIENAQGVLLAASYQTDPEAVIAVGEPCILKIFLRARCLQDDTRPLAIFFAENVDEDSFGLLSEEQLSPPLLSAQDREIRGDFRMIAYLQARPTVRHADESERTHHLSCALPYHEMSMQPVRVRSDRSGARPIQPVTHSP